MRNLLIATVALASTATILVLQRSSLARTRAETEALKSEGTVMRETIEVLESSLQDLERRKQAQQSELTDAAQRLQAELAQRTPVPELALDPRIEGNWPGERPYFYLAKEHIPTLDYQPVSGAGRVTPEAAILFGMTAAERGAIDEAFQSAFAQLHASELMHGYVTNAPLTVQQTRASHLGQSISVCLPANPMAEELKIKTAGRMAEILGEERFKMFGQRAQESEINFGAFGRQDRIVTLIPKSENIGEIIVSNPNGSTFHTYNREREMDWITFQYAHIFDYFLPHENNF